MDDLDLLLASILEGAEEDKIIEERNQKINNVKQNIFLEKIFY